MPVERTHPRVLDSPPPTKRRRISPSPAVKIEEAAPLLHSPPRVQASPPPAPRAPSPPPVRIKLEARTPSPPPRRAVRSGSKRCFPVPPECQKRIPGSNTINPNFLTNRRKWARAEGAVLADLGLTVEKSFFRDDGMVIEWTSNVDVWLDNLRPVQERPRIAIPVGQEIIDLDADDPEPVPPSRPPAGTSIERSASPILVPSSPAAELGHLDVEVPPELEVYLTVEEDTAQLQQFSIEFIKRYITTFDADRPAVASAYTADAIFSFRDNNFACPTHFTFQRTAREGATRPERTMPKLPALQNYRYSWSGDVINVDYDTVTLESDGEGRTKVMLNVYGQLLGVGGSDEGRTLAIDQAFVLRRPTKDEKPAGERDDAWPLLALSHLMVVREEPWVQWTGTVETL
ncbi:hypothetical protein C8R46DRAFT_1043228 [Mycena filopes]|nr:hypothetical protein C8R46DRAFT_1043228 [Mycena filopes]